MYLVCVDLALMTFSDIIDAITFHHHPIIPDSHYLSCHYVPVVMCIADPFMNLMYNFLGLISVDTPQQYLVFTFLVENILVQEESYD